MVRNQPFVLAPLPSAGRYLTLGLAGGRRAMLERLSTVSCGDDLVIGLGMPLVSQAAVPGLRTFPALAGPEIAIPSTQGAVWLSLGGSDPGALLHRARRVLAALGDTVRVDEDIATFQFGGGRDLSGYEDGTENPKGERKGEVAIATSGGPGLEGGSFCAVQRWVHDLARFERMSEGERDFVIGRHQSSNEEIGDAPPSAHVKRAAQETFEPEAFVLRRSMPYGDVREHGLYFVAYGSSLDPFERILRRMVGLEDGITDALFRLSRPVSGGYFWCPPTHADGTLELSALG